MKCSQQCQEVKLKLSLDIPKLNNIQRLSNVLGKLKLNKENDKF